MIALSLIVGWGVYECSRSLGEWDAWTVCLGRRIVLSAPVGGGLAGVAYTLFRSVQLSIEQSHLIPSRPLRRVRQFWRARRRLCAAQDRHLVVHAHSVPHSLCFVSNSYTFWEDQAIRFFFLSTLIPPLLNALSTRTTRLRHRIHAFSALFATCVRLMGMSTVFREEEHLWCGVTFFSGSGAAEMRTVVHVLLIRVPAGVLVPYGIWRVVVISKSDHGIASSRTSSLPR